MRGGAVPLCLFIGDLRSPLPNHLECPNKDILPLTCPRAPRSVAVITKDLGDSGADLPFWTPTPSPQGYP